MEFGLFLLFVVFLAISIWLWRLYSLKRLKAEMKKFGWKHPSEWTEEDVWSDEKIDSFAKEEDAKIVSWTLSSKTFEEIAGDDFWYGLQEDGFPTEFANANGVENVDYRRLTLLADLIGNEEVSQRKRYQLFSALYMRLYNSLSAPKRFFVFDPTQELTRQSQKQLLNWCSTYNPSSRHGSIDEYCKDVREMLGRSSKYKTGFFDGKYHGISYDEWLKSVLWDRRDKWFPRKIS